MGNVAGEAPRNAALIEPGELVGENTAADILGSKVTTLRNWRWKGVGPVFHKIGKSVRYRRSELTAFVDAGAQGAAK